MKITELEQKLKEIREAHGDLPVVKWELDSGLKSVENDCFQLIVNDDFSKTRYATHLAIK